VRPTSARTREAGFTLLEVLVAFAILSIAIVAGIQAFAQGLRLLRVSTGNGMIIFPSRENP